VMNPDATAAGAACTLKVRKNGTTPDSVLYLIIDDSATVGKVYATSAIVGLDSGQICEYDLDVNGFTVDYGIYVLGYWE